jgi:hypothetical protein
MKKTLLLFAAAFAFGAARAQVSVIPKVGLTLARQHFDQTPNTIFGKEYYKTNCGLTAGVGFNVPLSKEKSLFFLQPELLYVQKGQRFEYANEFYKAKGKDVMNYLEVPVLAQVKFGTEQIKCFVAAGPSLAYALGGRYAFDGVTLGGIAGGTSTHLEGRTVFRKAPENNISNNQYMDPAYFNRLDVGVQAGGGIGLAVGPGMLQLEARYGHSLTSFYKGNTDNNSTADDQANFWNRTLAFTLGYAIPLGGK